jgi:hypothetical protein
MQSLLAGLAAITVAGVAALTRVLLTANMRSDTLAVAALVGSTRSELAPVRQAAVDAGWYSLQWLGKLVDASFDFRLGSTKIVSMAALEYTGGS